jgi:hypothetical protein
MNDSLAKFNGTSNLNNMNLETLTDDTTPKSSVILTPELPYAESNPPSPYNSVSGSAMEAITRRGGFDGSSPSPQITAHDLVDINRALSMPSTPNHEPAVLPNLPPK